MSMNPLSPPTETEVMQDQFAIFRKQLVDIADFRNGLQTGGAETDPRIAAFKDGAFCLELALTFYEEANLALQAGAWFAAASIASSALESVLLGKCFFQEAEIRALPKFQKLKRNQKDGFGLFARSLDLGKLLEIADELSWFPHGGFPKTLTSHLAHHLDEGTLSGLIGLFEANPNVGQICAHHVREYRNLLHPAVCLKGRATTVKGCWSNYNIYIYDRVHVPDGNLTGIPMPSQTFPSGRAAKNSVTVVRHKGGHERRRLIPSQRRETRAGGIEILSRWRVIGVWI
jgi:hypothetical protein